MNLRPCGRLAAATLALALVVAIAATPAFADGGDNRDGNQAAPAPLPLLGATPLGLLAIGAGYALQRRRKPQA